MTQKMKAGAAAILAMTSFMGCAASNPKPDFTKSGNEMKNIFEQYQEQQPPQGTDSSLSEESSGES